MTAQKQAAKPAGGQPGDDDRPEDTHQRDERTSPHRYGGGDAADDASTADGVSHDAQARREGRPPAGVDDDQEPRPSPGPVADRPAPHRKRGAKRE